jgi:molecular chaperone GrpE
MTTGRRPAGAPAEEKQPAGVPSEETEESADREESADPGAAVDADLDALLADTQRQRDEYLELAQRTKADFENYKRRAATEAADAEMRGRTSIAAGLVPALDNLERALEMAGVSAGEVVTSSEEPESREVSAQEALAQGVALVLRELRETLRRAGVEAYDPAGEKFDPTWHEALSTRPAEGGPAGVVVETLDKGYRLDGRVIRPARVVVSE